MKKLIFALFPCSALFFQGCVTPYRGDTVLIPLTDTSENFCVMAGNNSAMLQYSTDNNHFFGLQSNYLNYNGRSGASDSVMIKSTFNNVRMFAGYQGNATRREHRFYVLGGFGMGKVNFSESYGQAMDSFYKKTSFGSLYQTVFAEAGIKLYKGYTEIITRGVTLNLDAPIYWMPHIGASLVHYNKANLVREFSPLGFQQESNLFGTDVQIPKQTGLQFKVGLAWIYSGEFMNYFWDITFNGGDYMVQTFHLRVGLGAHF